MVEVVVFIPLASNEGATFTPSHHAAFEAALLDRFGGFSKLTTVEGAWVDGGTRYVDHLTPYVVAVDGLLAKAPGLLEIIAFAKAHYGQLAIYVRYLGQSEVL